MPKATLTFNLPEETDEFKDAQDGSALRGVLQEMSNKLRSLVKHGSEEDAKWAEKAQDLLHQSCEGVDIW